MGLKVDEEEAVLRATLSKRLRGQLSDPETADSLASSLFDLALTWRPREIPIDKVDTVIAFALGLREDLPDDPVAVAGLVNEAIARSIVAISQARPDAKIYAQWEVARVLHHRCDMPDAVSIDRQIDENGEVYLSTWGVARQAIECAGGDPAALGVVAVAAHHDHAWRCVSFCRTLGIDAYVATGIPLATGYDEQSTQNFTLDAQKWQIYDLTVRLQGERHRMLGF